MAMMKMKVTPEDLEKVGELRARRLSRVNIATIMGVSFAHIKYIISLLPKTPRKWFCKERKTFTDAMPNPFPKWWCKKHNLDHNFYRPEWKK